MAFRVTQPRRFVASWFLFHRLNIIAVKQLYYAHECARLWPIGTTIPNWHLKFAWCWVNTPDAGRVRWRYVYRMREYKAYDYLWRRSIYGWRYRCNLPQG